MVSLGLEEKPAVECVGLTKLFSIPHNARHALRDYFTHPLSRASHEVNKALIDVNVAISPGEFFGIIGPNGTGKSTLLKIIAGIYRQTSGIVRVNGKLSPFIELGVGFNLELNARDNVRINGTLLGLSLREIGERFHDIIAFAELERFVDQKLKNYSMGMQLRLAYSIAIRAPYEILLLDEAFAVGDENFQQKCRETFVRMRSEGKTVIIVSHDLEWIGEYCDRALLLRDGLAQRVGPAKEVVGLYLEQEEAAASD